ncbi:MAG: hypothetical protein UV38_C0003G0012 [candidate division TM6 bacterium GW2011_GWE2_42_60]|nr:MAG: hypothetical protein UV38_C0003G0012 [candidate division TM6 bacterium GW2011_GWE2_42_60]HBY05931.1 hypothetical protein [Candidatus Dependentiae bacterium]
MKMLFLGLALIALFGYGITDARQHKHDHHSKGKRVLIGGLTTGGLGALIGGVAGGGTGAAIGGPVGLVAGGAISAIISDRKDQR